MRELEWRGQPELPSLRRALRHTLRRDVPSLRVVAENFLAEASTIDLLGVGPEGEWVSVRIANVREDADGLVKSLADLEWLRARRADLAQLAPTLGLNSTSEPRALLFCPDFGTESRAAARRFSPRTVELLQYRCFQQSGQLALALERVTAPGRPLASQPPQSASATAHPPPPAQRPTEAGQGRGDSNEPARERQPALPSTARPTPSGAQHGLGLSPTSPSRFRTGLRETDLLRERA